MTALTLILAAPALSAADCTECHDAEPDPERFAASVHGFLDCADCHNGAEDFPHSEDVARVDCGVCHGDVVEAYGESVHGRSRSNGGEEAPACAACHGDPHVLVPGSDSESPVNRARLADTCGACHSDPAMVEKYRIPVATPIEAYRASVHGRLTAEGVEAASCSDCHGSHGILDAADPASSVNHLRVPDTCGKCHEEIAVAFAASVHGEAASHGVREAPVCTDCHGEHRILSPDEKGSPVYASNIPKMTCGRCHGDLRVAEKFGIQTDAVRSYEDSYHGLASRSGRVTVANCASCHGVHDIQPSSNPSSHVNPANLAETCGACHPGAGERFAIGSVHVLPTDRDNAVVYWVRRVYLSLIWLTIGGMVLHNLLDLYRKMRRPPPRGYGKAPVRERMSLGFRIAHWALIGSFIVLAHSGFALAYPEAWWAKPFLSWEAGLGLRGTVHRAAAVLMMLALALHVAHLIVDRAARRAIAAMRPSWEDVRELRERVWWLVGRKAEPPKAPALGYPEKMEYLALIWGLLVMAATGFLLWFDNLALRFLPKWVGDVATVIHFYEAVLASLAILVWHLYFVILDPVVYPMDTAWLTGRSAPGRALERDEPLADRPEVSRSPGSERGRPSVTATGKTGGA
jgi:cytochrome b subunit of formate dehydrogenase